MTEKEMMQRNIEDFSRIQRYIELKIILSVSGVNLAELDHLKE